MAAQRAVMEPLWPYAPARVLTGLIGAAFFEQYVLHLQAAQLRIECLHVHGRLRHGGRTGEDLRGLLLELLFLGRDLRRHHLVLDGPRRQWLPLL